jgi:diaminohydroxyphosphoribosylaminopyrimidine deaminase/5-amino-6-(5-phosphoribosylamino)uracil reductase
MDAILVGSGTVRADDPLLTARPPGPRMPARIVLDSHGSLPLTSQLARTTREAPVIVAASESHRRDELEQAGCEVLILRAVDDRLSLSALLDELGRRRMTNILIEGGSTVLGSFLDANAIDEVHVFIAPKLVGGAAALSPVGGVGASQIADALVLADWQVEMVDTDVLLHGWIRR